MGMYYGLTRGVRITVDKKSQEYILQIALHAAF